MADDADKSASGVIDTPRDQAKDEASPETPKPQDKAPGSFGDEPTKKKRGRPPGSKNKAASAGPVDGSASGKSKAWVAKQLATLLRSPGFVFEATGDPWAVEHVDKSAPELAKAIAEHAEKNPAFKSRLVAFLEGGETAGLVFAGLMYVAPLAIYFGVLPIPPHFRARLPIPQRGHPSAAGAPMTADMFSMGSPSQEALEAEAKAKGFDDLGDYLNAVQAAINGVQGPGVTAPPI